MILDSGRLSSSFGNALTEAFALAAASQSRSRQHGHGHGVYSNVLYVRMGYGSYGGNMDMSSEGLVKVKTEHRM